MPITHYNHTMTLQDELKPSGWTKITQQERDAIQDKTDIRSAQGLSKRLEEDEKGDTP